MRDVIGEEKLSDVWGKYSKRIIAGDESARQELGDELRTTYIAAAEKQFAEATAGGNVDAFFETGNSAQPGRAELLQKLRETLGDERVAELREKYADRIRAGDEQALEALKQEVRRAYEQELGEDLLRRPAVGD